MLVALTCSPVWVLLAFQSWVIVCDELPKSQPTFQLETASPRLVTSTWAWNPPGHSFTFVYLAEHPAAANAWLATTTTPAVATTAAADMRASLRLIDSPYIDESPVEVQTRSVPVPDRVKANRPGM